MIALRRTARLSIRPPAEEGPHLKPLSLLLPALIPSWNFFDVIAPSPRIEYALTASSAVPKRGWTEFRPRPQRVSARTLLARLLWNPRWNETLFLVSCAERLINAPTDHSQDEIFTRLAADLTADGATGDWLSFRLVFVSREDEAIQREVLFQSAPRRLSVIAAR
jgi:hypothetical protein